MKTALEFDLPEERVQYECAYNGSKYKETISKILDMLDSQISKGNLDCTPLEKIIEFKKLTV